MINYDEFKKVEITIGQILKAEKIPNTDKLLRLEVDFGLKPVVAQNPEPAKKEGEVAATDSAPVETPLETVVAPELIKEPERDVRQIVSGISTYFPEPEKLIGVRCAFVTNLEPRQIKGYVSHGMILAVGGGEEPFSLFQVDDKIKSGVKAK